MASTSNKKITCDTLGGFHPKFKATRTQYYVLDRVLQCCNYRGTGDDEQPAEHNLMMRALYKKLQECKISCSINGERCVGVEVVSQKKDVGRRTDKVKGSSAVLEPFWDSNGWASSKGHHAGTFIMTYAPMKKEMRGHIAHQIYRDFDIVSCHPVISEGLFHKNGYETPVLSSYNIGPKIYRMKIASTMNSSYDRCKTLMLRATNGGSPSKWAKELGLDDGMMPVYVTSYRQEMIDNRDKLLESSEEYIALVKDREKMNGDARNKDAKRSAFAVALQDWERRIMEASVVYTENNCGGQVDVTVYDGFMCAKTEKLKPDFSGMSKYAEKLTGILVQWEEKEMKEWDVLKDVPNDKLIPFEELYPDYKGQGIQSENAFKPKKNAKKSKAENEEDDDTIDLSKIEDFIDLHTADLLVKHYMREVDPSDFQYLNADDASQTLMVAAYMENSVKYDTVSKDYWIFDDEKQMWTIAQPNDVYRRIICIRKACAVLAVKTQLRKIKDEMTNEETTASEIKCMVTSLNEIVAKLSDIGSARSTKSIFSLLNYINHPNFEQQLDNNPWLLGVENGVVDLRNGLLLDRKAEHMISHICPVKYMKPIHVVQDYSDDEENEAADGAADEAADVYDEHYNRWVKCVKNMVKGNEDMENFLQMICGICLCGLSREEVIIILYGSGRNGKGAIIEFLEFMLGNLFVKVNTGLVVENASSINHEGTELAAFKGKRCAVAEEPPPVASSSRNQPTLKVGKIQELTGANSITCADKYKKKETFLPTHTLMLACNYKPVLPSVVPVSLQERIVLFSFSIQFTATTPNEVTDTRKMCDPQLKYDMKNGMKHAVFWWMVQGASKYHQQVVSKGIRLIDLRPQQVIDDSAEYLASEDQLRAFVADSYVTDEKCLGCDCTGFYADFKNYLEFANVQRRLDGLPIIAIPKAKDLKTRMVDELYYQEVVRQMPQDNASRKGTRVYKNLRKLSAKEKEMKDQEEQEEQVINDNVGNGICDEDDE